MNDLIKLAKDNWHKTSGLVFSQILAFSISFALLSSFTIDDLIRIVIYVVVFLIVLFFWYKNRTVRKRKKNKVGFVISIATFDEVEESKIKQDFIDSINTLLLQGRTGSSFDVIILPNHIAQNVKNYDDAYSIRRKAKAHFVLFGKVRLRKIGGSNKHVINLEGLVSHKPLIDEARGKLKKEFKELFPKNVNLSEEDDLILFEFTSSWTVSVAKYIIGIAAAMSGDLNYAEKLFNDLNDSIKLQDHNFPIFKKLSNRIPLRLSEIAETKASSAYDGWKATRDESFLELMKKNLDKIHPKQRNNYEYILLESIYLFLAEKNTTKAISILKKCKRNRNGTWRLNLAFLFAYIGDLKGAYKEYCLAQRMTLSDPILIEVESFICSTLESDPTKYQFHYCLGVINWYLKGDKKQALKDFKNFISEIKNGEYIFEKSQVENWINKLERNITSVSSGMLQ